MNSIHFQQIQQNFTKKKVGSSETIRNESYQTFFEWLAGLLDADGGFYISRDKYVSCEITMHEKEIQTLYFIKSQIGGSVTPRKNKQAFRWRLHKKVPLIPLMHELNGKFQTDRLQKQFAKACQVYGINPLSNSRICLETAWFSGFFCGEGSFVINPAAHFQPSISCGQKEKPILEEIQYLFGGGVYYDKSWDGWYWWVDARSIHSSFYDYFTRYSLHNVPKQARFKSLLRFCGYLQRGLHKDPNSQGRLVHFVKVFQKGQHKLTLKR